MSKVMLDNWGMTECINKRFDVKNNYDGYRHFNHYGIDDKITDACWQNFLTSCILWDDIYLMFDDSSFSLDLETPYFINFAKQYISQNDFLHINKRRSIGKYDYYKIVNLYTRTQSDDLKDYDKELLMRAYIYLSEANLSGYSYVPHPIRAKLLYDSQIFKKGFDRKLYLDIIDEEVDAYINYVNELCKNQLMTTSIPVLYKFISDNAKDVKEELDIAISLRNDKNVRKLRESLNEIEKEVSNGFLFNLAQSLLIVKDICNEITDTLYKKPLSTEISLGLSPAINIGCDFDVKTSSTALHTTFLYDITKYAIKGDLENRYKKYF
ncbi:MAG: hypothetical protein IKM66_06835 [Clostridia bacterium]|nr:hypothetical protein [Clostridia bacterium]